jgi:hypothetical protein
LGWADVINAFMLKWIATHGGVRSSISELEEEEGGAGALHAAVAGGHADSAAVLLLHGFTRNIAQCCVVAAARSDELCLLRLLLFTKTVGGGGGLDVLLRVPVASPSHALKSPRLEQHDHAHTTDITLLLPLLAALCAWHNMVDPLVAICVAAWEAGVAISGPICIQDECALCLSPAAAAPLPPMFAQSPLLCQPVSASALHIAAAHSATAAAVVLLGHCDTSLDVNAVDSGGRTALMWCMRSKCIPLAKLLLIAGADVFVGQEASDRHASCRNSGIKSKYHCCIRRYLKSNRFNSIFRDELDAASGKNRTGSFRKTTSACAVPAS